MKKSIFIIISLVILFFILFFYYNISSIHSKPTSDQIAVMDKVIISGQTIDVEISDTSAKRELGLSGHAPLLNNQGMFFVFDVPDKYAFWMKDMLFPLDIIWINSDMKVVYIEKNLEPNSYPKLFSSNEDALYVLELNAGFSDKNNLQIGDILSYK
ncbi:MAG: DUF192 domain-containing protein [Candidatus Nomurabacteria bacterium]|nr:DUF192 domain-containing protein [Candidatus Nomurabacteria bacterium]